MPFPNENEISQIHRVVGSYVSDGNDQVQEPDQDFIVFTVVGLDPDFAFALKFGFFC